MRRKRRTHSPEFKAKAALAAIQGDLTMAELVKKFDVHANQITDWKKQLLSNAPDVFGNGAKKAEDATEMIQELHAKIGQLTMENDFLERRLERIHVPKPVSEEELEQMALIDRCHLKHPFYGSRRIRDWLEDHGYWVNRKKVQRLMRTMDLVAQYPKAN